MRLATTDDCQFAAFGHGILWNVNKILGIFSASDAKVLVGSGVLDPERTVLWPLSGQIILTEPQSFKRLELIADGTSTIVANSCFAEKPTVLSRGLSTILPPKLPNKASQA
jgi:hypothetical protein